MSGWTFCVGSPNPHLTIISVGGIFSFGRPDLVLQTGSPVSSFPSFLPLSDHSLSDRGRMSRYILSFCNRCLYVYQFSSLVISVLLLGGLLLQSHSRRVLGVVPLWEVPLWCSQLLQRYPSWFSLSQHCLQILLIYSVREVLTFAGRDFSLGPPLSSITP